MDYFRKFQAGFAQVLNSVDFLIENPCKAEWDIYLETGLKAAKKVILILLIPSSDEILEEYLHPKIDKDRKLGAHHDDPRRRGAPGGKNRRAWQAGIPDVDSLIAKRLPGASFFEGRNAGLLERFLWLGIDVADRVAWWFLCASLVNDFTYEWASGVMESKFCSADWDAWAGGTWLPSGPLGNSAAVCQGEVITKDEHNAQISDVGGDVTASGQFFTGFFTCLTPCTAFLTPPPTRIGEYFLRLQYDLPGGGVAYVDGAKVELKEGESAPLSLAVAIPLTTSCHAELWIETLTPAMFAVGLNPTVSAMLKFA